MRLIIEARLEDDKASSPATEAATMLQCWNVRTAALPIWDSH
jgi:hypothetical protein